MKKTYLALIPVIFLMGCGDSSNSSVVTAPAPDTSVTKPEGPLNQDPNAAPPTTVSAPAPTPEPQVVPAPRKTEVPIPDPVPVPADVQTSKKSK